jgi:hypothetical protein
MECRRSFWNHKQPNSIHTINHNQIKMEKVTENNTVDTCTFVFNLKHDWAEHIAQYGHYKNLQWLDQKYGGAQNGYPT